ncbi:NAD(P)-binding protein [Mytilinidion resinicola]|uniref:NAD(P)-binding protein n=1 Tax=Mytilinidion resinicola TaxID=574789 RepID=A0A6A6Y0L8_9PEZI|nr:NAD(P)-binding protein [Mytilinidion resinicola]KAF2802312.1 NAD(P)-binding protein [Mytilinidion resinicola]
MAPKVFLTGANGFVASHILAQLIENKYEVVASVRSPAKAEEVLALHPSYKTAALSFTYIADIATPGAFDDVFKSTEPGFDYVFHTASPVNFSVKDAQKELIDPAVQGTIGIIESAHKLGGKTLKRFVLLGSAVAVLNSFEDMSKAGKPYTEADWNPVTADYAISHNDMVAAYNVAKILAERAAWAFVETAKPGFDLVVINPDIIIGPMLQAVNSAKAVNETNTFAVYSFFNGTNKKIEEVAFPFYHFVDVRDVARAHVLALEKPAAGGKRNLLVAGLITPQLVANLIRKNFPELRERVAEGTPEQTLPKGVQPTGWDTSRNFEVFGPDWRYIGLEESLVDTVKSILELEKQWK